MEFEQQIGNFVFIWSLFPWPFSLFLVVSFIGFRRCISSASSLLVFICLSLYFFIIFLVNAAVVFIWSFHFNSFLLSLLLLTLLSSFVLIQELISPHIVSHFLFFLGAGGSLLGLFAPRLFLFMIYLFICPTAVVSFFFKFRFLFIIIYFIIIIFCCCCCLFG